MYIDLSEWEFKDYFGDCSIYGKGNDRVLVEKDTQNITFQYKMKGGEVDKQPFPSPPLEKGGE